MIAGFTLMLLLVGVSADVKPCCGPTKWTGEVIQTIGEYNADMDAASLAYGNTTIYYDYDNKQLAFKQVLENTTDHTYTVTHRRIIIKYGTTPQAERYVIINQTCTKESIKEAMETPCIPADAGFLGTHVFATNLTVNVWLVYDTVTQGSRRVAVTDKTCMKTTMSRVTGGPDYRLQLNVYQNVTVGISDPSVFDIPSFCGGKKQRFEEKLLFQSVY